MDKFNKLPEEVIRDDFFGLSYTSQIKIFNFYLEILSNYGDIDDYKYFRDVFLKYMKLISRFCEFKSRFSEYDNETIKMVRDRINFLRSKITPDNKVKIDDDFFVDSCEDIQMYYPNTITDSFVDEYIYNAYSYSRKKSVEICLDFANHYSKIKELDFQERFRLCNGNKDLFNPEIKKLSNDFYSLYYSMGTIERMTYIWHLSFYDSLYIDKNYGYDETLEYINIFSDEKIFVRLIDSDYIRPTTNRKALSKYFKIT